MTARIIQLRRSGGRADGEEGRRNIPRGTPSDRFGTSARPPELRTPDLLDAWRLPMVVAGMAAMTWGAWWIRAWSGR